MTLMLAICLLVGYAPLKAETMTISWYGKQHHGKRTASGQKFDMNKMTVAHRTLPFGTRVRIHFKNKSATATVTDRGPFKKGRQMDVSYAVAKQLGVLNVGIFKGKVYVLK